MAEPGADNPRSDLTYDDVVVGQEIETSGHTVSQADIMKFAEVTLDHHPLHTDPDYCRDAEFGRPIAAWSPRRCCWSTRPATW